MNRLKLEHLAPYLPYGVKFISEMDKPYDEYGRQPIWTLNGVFTLFSEYSLITKENNDAYNIHKCKLSLRPLSDLTKEIEHNGEIFVPIVELYGLRSQVSSSDYSDYYIENSTAILRMKGVYFYQKLFKTFFEVDIDPDNVSFSIATECWEDDKMTEERISLCGNEMSMYKTLLSWHFDVFGLREKNLCVYYNEI